VGILHYYTEREMILSRMGGELQGLFKVGKATESKEHVARTGSVIAASLGYVSGSQ
jgi:hypothetical protein